MTEEEIAALEREAPVTWPKDKCLALLAVARAANRLRKGLELFATYEPQEIVKDEFAYDRLVDNMRASARRLLGDKP